MTAEGDPQGVNRARMGLMGAVGDLILVGTAFIIPRVIGETVIEQVGGVSVTVEASQDCDELLRQQFVFQRNTSTSERLNAVIGSVQSQHRETCNVDIWNPVVVNAVEPPRVTDSDFVGSPLPACGDASSVGGQSVPSGLVLRTSGDFGTNTAGYSAYRGLLSDGGGEIVRDASGRDRDNNIIVHWSEEPGQRPTDNSKCWMYVSGLDRWFVQY